MAAPTQDALPLGKPGAVKACPANAGAAVVAAIVATAPTIAIRMRLCMEFALLLGFFLTPSSLRPRFSHPPEHRPLSEPGRSPMAHKGTQPAIRQNARVIGRAPGLAWPLVPGAPAGTGRAEA